MIGDLQYSLDLIGADLIEGKPLHPGKKNISKNRFYLFKDIAYIVELTQDRWMVCCDSPTTRRLLRLHTFCYNKDGYAKTSIKGTSKAYHQLALQYEKGLVADHINRKRLDNRLSNLRIVSIRVNATNMTRSTRNPYGKIGVSSYIHCHGDDKIGYNMYVCEIRDNTGDRIRHKFNKHLNGTDEKALEMAIAKRKELEILYGYIGE